MIPGADLLATIFIIAILMVFAGMVMGLTSDVGILIGFAGVVLIFIVFIVGLSGSSAPDILYSSATDIVVDTRHVDTSHIATMTVAIYDGCEEDRCINSFSIQYPKTDTKYCFTIPPGARVDVIFIDLDGERNVVRSTDGSSGTFVNGWARANWREIPKYNATADGNRRPVIMDVTLNHGIQYS
jgi:hypothetical protein